MWSDGVPCDVRWPILEMFNIERSDTPQASNLKSSERCSDCTLNWGRQTQIDITHQRPRSMDVTNPLPNKPFRAGSYEVRTRARSLVLALVI